MTRRVRSICSATSVKEKVKGKKNIKKQRQTVTVVICRAPTKFLTVNVNRRDVCCGVSPSREETASAAGRKGVGTVELATVSGGPSKS